MSESRPPIILGNSPRTGSTLLRVVLHRHKNICSGGELGILDKPDWLRAAPEVYEQHVDEWLRKGYPRAFVGLTRPAFTNLDDYPWTASEVRELAGAVSSYKDLVDAFYARHLLATGANRWLEKTPANVFAFDAIAELYPSAKFVHIVRDGRDVVVSLSRRGVSPFKAVCRWYYATLTGVQFRGLPNYLELRYEDLVTSPSVELKRVCDFLEEQYDDSLLDGAKAERDAVLLAERPVSSHSIGRHREELSNDHRAAFRAVRLTKRTLHSGAYREILSPIELQSYLGYETKGLVDAPMPSARLRVASYREKWKDHLRSIAQFGRVVHSPVRLS